MGVIQSISSSRRSNKKTRLSTHQKSSTAVSDTSSWSSSSGALSRPRAFPPPTQYHHDHSGSAKHPDGVNGPHRPQQQSTAPSTRDDDDNDGDYGVHQSSYFLPDNWDTEDRFFSAHIALKRLFGEIAASAILRKLQQQPSCRIVEIGCGNGPWLMEAASRYPHCHFIGVEFPTVLGHTPPSVSFLSNVTLEPIDLNADPIRLPFPDHSIDVIYGRSLGYRFADTVWTHLIQEMHRIIKPGGLIQMVEGILSAEGTFLIDSFVETTKKAAELSGRNFEAAVVLGQKAEQQGLRVLERTLETVQMGRQGGRLGQEFMAVILRSFSAIFPALGPFMKLDEDEYNQRVEMFCAQCVQHNAVVDWYSYVLTADP